MKVLSVRVSDDLFDDIQKIVDEVTVLTRSEVVISWLQAGVLAYRQEVA